MKEYSRRVFKLLTRRMGTKETERLMKPLENHFLKSENLKVDEDVELSMERLKNNFRNYAVYQEENADFQEKRRALELDLLLSELFTARQKELMRKRLEGRPMSKTEKEYYYRVVGKRLKALASEELHQMARDLVS
jgi:hypothetical protein